MNGADTKKMLDEEITTELGRLRTRIYDLRTQSVTEKVENVAQFGLARRDIARLLTERTARHNTKQAGSAPKKPTPAPAPAPAKPATKTTSAKARAKAAATKA